MLRFTILTFIINTIINISSLNAQQSPYGGNEWQIPGIIEAENYDLGGEGIAYHDTDTGNNGSQYRNDDVDIEACIEDGYNVGWMQAGEWIEYSVHILYAGKYNLRVRVAAAQAGGQIHFSFNGNDVTSIQDVPNTGNWQQWTWLDFTGVQLDSGKQIMRMIIDNSGFNVNYVQFIRQIDTEYPSITLTSPKDGNEYNLGDQVSITAYASDTDGSIQKVEFFVNDALINSDLTSPFGTTWIPDAPGSFSIYAAATDNMGATTLSDTAQIKVKSPDLPDAPNYSVKHGFYSSPFDLIISWNDQGSTIRYTLDGSDPRTNPSAFEHTSPVTIRIDPSNTTGRAATPAVTVRAYARLNSAAVTEAGSNTYIFLENIKTQKYPGGNWPEGIVNQKILDYEMDPDVINDSRYKNSINESLLAIPSICINTDLKNLFDPATGIYVNPTGRGSDWERPISIELIDPNNKEEGFQINAGLRIRGGYSRIPGYEGGQYKHAFRFFFRDEYGKAKLKYPLFGKEGVSEFDCIDLRTAQNYSWSYQPYSGHVCIFIRDLFSRDCQRDMGQPYTRSRPYHLYINGMYWGLYQSEERPEASYAESYFGSNKEDYDVVKIDPTNGNKMEATDGTLDAYNQLWSYSMTGFTKNEDYFKIQGKNSDGSVNMSFPVLVNLDNLIDYMMIIFYTGNFDSPITAFGSNQSPNNVYGTRNRTDRSGFKFFVHDAEHSLMDPTYSENTDYGYDRTGPYPCGNAVEYFNPQWLHQQLSGNAEYEILFADHVYKNFFNKGVLTPAESQQRLAARRDEINMAVIAESARWGDTKVEKPRTKDDDWLPAVNWIMNTYFPTRTSIVLQQLKDKNLYPSIEPPVFFSGTQEIVDNNLSLNPGSKIKIVNNNSSKTGTIIYTLDGSDPRAVGGALNISAVEAGDEIELTVSSNAILKTRIKNNGIWSALHEIHLNTGENLSGLKITEILYNPLPDGNISSSEFEFVEFKNISSSPLYLAGNHFVQGIEYTFPDSSRVLPNQFLVLASNAEEFYKRYGFAPYAEFNGQLDNKGERIVLVNMFGDTLISARYNNKYPYPEQPDSLGYSLVAASVYGTGDPASPEYWHASDKINGSPGYDDLVSNLDDSKDKIPFTFSLDQNYPNPFNPETIISYQIPAVETGYSNSLQHVELKVFDILGREIKTLINKEQSAGKYTVKFNGEKLSSGIYLYRIRISSHMGKTEDYIQSRKMLLLR